ncbi:Kelch repeat-containing protein [Pelagicoccus mobilis]|uniref:Attractin/MKLN-like beta-propeller domain-containing protein n=1 Tax=Pelagicoccus mobilis TaxID=415221 RepID=A0A934RZ15_9BACT|nr:kelch repeat-containing protein [Pelagicoccus mobilis]MBK1878953.1 hypothetical protein [Pelagicoccus mobilis]
MKYFTCLLSLFLATHTLEANWESVQSEGEPVARHEAAFIEFEGKFYLLGGRGIRPVSIYSPEDNSWKQGTPPPVEVHHFQPVVWEDRILLICAFTGKWPKETPLDKVLAYVPATDSWEWSHEIPADRRRAAAGVVHIGDKIYIAGGIINGHIDGHVDWFDEYDPSTGTWSSLPNAPHKRDHFQAAFLDGKLYSAGGRLSSTAPNEGFLHVIPEVDVYDFQSKTWSVLDKPLPTPRAGSFTLALHPDIIVAGGESASQVEAHAEVEAYNTQTDTWSSLPDLIQGRHGTGMFLFGDHLYTCSGCGNRGGNPELTTMERLKVK